MLDTIRQELDAALAARQCSSARRRLISIRSLLDGKSIAQVASDANVTDASVRRWLKGVSESGFPSLLRDGRHGHPKWRMTATQADETRRQLAAVLARPLKPEVAERLIAIDIALSGRPIDEAAASARVLPGTVRRWLRAVARDGLHDTLADWLNDRRLRPGKLDVDPTSLRELAAGEINFRVRKRIRAVLCVAEGMSTYDAAAKVGMNPRDITKRVRRVQQEGLAGFKDRHPFGRPAKLTEAQLQHLRTQVLSHPEMPYSQLQSLVRNRFGITYTIAGLRLVLKRDLRITRNDGRFGVNDFRSIVTSVVSDLDGEAAECGTGAPVS